MYLASIYLVNKKICKKSSYFVSTLHHETKVGVIVNAGTDGAVVVDELIFGHFSVSISFTLFLKKQGKNYDIIFFFNLLIFLDFINIFFSFWLFSSWDFFSFSFFQLLGEKYDIKKILLYKKFLYFFLYFSIFSFSFYNFSFHFIHLFFYF